jgi:hypothetical protein
MAITRGKLLLLYAEGFVFIVGALVVVYFLTRSEPHTPKTVDGFFIAIWWNKYGEVDRALRLHPEWAFAVNKNPIESTGFSVPAGLTSLQFARRCGCDGVVKLLMLKCQSLSPADLQETLVWAAERGYVQVVKVALDRGAHANARDAEGKTALHHSCGYQIEPMTFELHSRDGDSVAVARILIEHGADINAKDNGGKTPLAIAQDAKKAAIVKYLISAGAT